METKHLQLNQPSWQSLSFTTVETCRMYFQSICDILIQKLNITERCWSFRGNFGETDIGKKRLKYVIKHIEKLKVTIPKLIWEKLWFSAIIKPHPHILHSNINVTLSLNTELLGWFVILHPESLDQKILYVGLLYRLGGCDCADAVRNTVVKEPRGQEGARTWAWQASPHEQLKGLCSASVAVMSSCLRRGWTLPYNLLECLTHTGQSLTKHTPTQHHFVWN